VTDPELRKKLRAAIVDHLRWWLAGDGVHMRRLHTNGVIDPRTLRKIANDYFVSRGLREGKENQIAEMIQDKLQNWPNSLKARADVVYCLAEEAEKEGGADETKQLTHGLQLSGFSKLCWFMRPEGWTMYDKYAQWGLARPKKSIGFKPFYKRLETLNFIGVTTNMRNTIEASDLPNLWPERIIDKYLMQCGQTDTNDFSAVQEQADYLAVQQEFFGSSFTRKIDRLTDQLLQVVENEPIFAVHKESNPRQEQQK